MPLHFLIDKFVCFKRGLRVVAIVEKLSDGRWEFGSNISIIEWMPNRRRGLPGFREPMSATSNLLELS